MIRKKILGLLILIIILGGIGGVLFTRFVIPYLATVRGFNWVEKLESNNPVIINRREEVRINDGANIAEVVRQAGTYTVSIYSTGSNIKFLENGIIVTADGMVLTSRVNLPQSGNVSVITNEGKIFIGEVRAMDPKSELAVVTLQNAGNLAVAQFADASNLQASARLLFLGRSNAEFTRKLVPGNVISTIANEASLDKIYDSERFEDTIHSDAVLNSDFIGGPVVNLDGRVVGLTLSNLGILPGEHLQTAVEIYLKIGKIQRPVLGLKYLSFSTALAKLKGLPQAGLLVDSLDENLSAEKSGLQVNDLIIAVDGQELTSDMNFEKLLGMSNSGNLPITIFRNGNKMDLAVALGMK